MDKPVSFELAKLLKEKGFDNPTQDCYNLNGLLFSNGWCEYVAEDSEFDGLIRPEKLKEKDVLAPTIAEVVMWLYEEHGVWIRVEPDWDGDFWAQIKSKNIPDARIGKWMVVNAFAPYKTPTEAYEAAIEYTLKTLVP